MLTIEQKVEKIKERLSFDPNTERYLSKDKIEEKFKHEIEVTKWLWNLNAKRENDPSLEIHTYEDAINRLAKCWRIE